ncbi:MAG: hypothetical protein ABID61_04495 [Candidatus Micrarchaeota archaeon]
MKFGNRKGQAVMEYLITYGLALFVILIVLGILVAVVIPTLKVPEGCQFTQPGFSCNQKQHVIVADKTDNTVTALFYLSNDQGSAVNITGVICSAKPAGSVEKSEITALTPSITLAPGGAYSFNSTGCTDENGVGVIMTPNSNFKGSIAIKYKRMDDVSGAPERMAVATLTGNVQESD